MDSLPQAYASLIGIDHYVPHTLPGNTQEYKSLNECVRDADHLEELLRSRLDPADEPIMTLLPLNSKKITPVELVVPYYELPTYRAIVEALQRLLEISQPGDFLFLYFAGHGARVVSALPEGKAIDEVLVPMDACSPQGRYLHDVELAY